jgi:ribonuclease HII
MINPVNNNQAGSNHAVVNQFSHLSQASVKEVKVTIDKLPRDKWEDALDWLMTDERSACQSLAKSFQRKIELAFKEDVRMEMLFLYEREAKSKGFQAIAGIDEAGRGPLVGPVVAAAVILDENVDWRGIDDSKKLSAAQRDHFYERIMKHAHAIGVGMADHKEIDEINILNATKLAMARALEQMSVKPDYLLIDAVKLNEVLLPQDNLIKGDSKSASIAAASIVAKVTRDRLLETLHCEHPVYDFASNKGYGTEKHYAAIREHGLIEAHRRSFLKGFL